MPGTENDKQSAPLPVWIVDDDDVRYSIRFALATHNLMAATYASGEEFLAAVNPEEPGCLVVDMTMEGMSGLDVLRHLRELDSPIKVILLSGNSTVRLAVRAMEEGVLSFMEKPVDPEELASKVNEALRLSALEYRKVRLRNLMRTLSRREAQIFDLLCQGKTSAVIAEQLFLSQRTVEVHRANIAKHLGGIAPICVLYELARTDTDTSPVSIAPRQRKRRTAKTAD